MFRWMSGVVLWKYADDTPVEKLYRHHHFAWRVLQAWLTSGVLAFSLLAEFFLSVGWKRDILFVVACIVWSVNVILCLPAIAAFVWAGEIEAVLKVRGLPSPKPPLAGIEVGKVAMKMCFWAVVLVLGVNLFR